MADTPFPRLQAVATILTPVMLGVGGLVLSSQQEETSRQIEVIAQTVSAVEAMQPYMALLADGSSEKAKMAAYALYKLNANDKKAAVYIILAANRRESNEVLQRLGMDDPEVRDIVTGVIGDFAASGTASVDSEAPDPDEVTVKTETALTDAAVEITRSYSVEGWMYLGTLGGEGWTTRQVEVAGRPEVGGEYEVLDDTYLRIGKPRLPFYKLAGAIGVVKEGDVVRVLQLDLDVGANRVWAKVQILPPER